MVISRTHQQSRYSGFLPMKYICTCKEVNSPVFLCRICMWNSFLCWCIGSVLYRLRRHPELSSKHATKNRTPWSIGKFLRRGNYLLGLWTVSANSSYTWYTSRRLCWSRASWVDRSLSICRLFWQKSSLLVSEDWFCYITVSC